MELFHDGKICIMFIYTNSAYLKKIACLGFMKVFVFIFLKYTFGSFQG